MKAMQIMSFTILLFASFYLLSATGIFFNMETFEDPGYFTRIIYESLITGFIVAVATGILLSKFGVNPYVTTGMRLFIDFFWGCYTALMTLLNLIATQFGSIFQGVMASFSLVLGLIFVLVTYYALLQMSTGGTKGYD